MTVLGSCMVEMEDGSSKRVDEVAKGDCVKGGYKVECVVKQKVNRKLRVVKFPLGLIVSAWHPCREQLGNSVLPPARLDEHGGILPYAHQGEQLGNSVLPPARLDEHDGILPYAHQGDDSHMEWKYPCLWLGKVNSIFIDQLYDFVLDRGHTLVINGLQVVTLGHGNDGSIVGDTYYGTDAVLEGFKEKYAEGWEKGEICFDRLTY